MADITVTAANVVQPAGVSPSRNIAGVAITAGEVLYIDTNNKAQLAKADTATHAAAAGIAVNNAASGQFVDWVATGTITIGGTVAVGTIYIVSPNNAGGIAPEGDRTTGEFVTILGIGASSTTINLNPYVSGIASA